LPIYATEKLMGILTEIPVEPYDASVEVYLAALRRCRQKLDATDDELLQMRYVDELSTVEIANRLQRLQPSVSRSLNRIRRWLFECIEMELIKREYSSKELS
jgi:DNA-directed RNA polymerase specialized sigma24 family protein